MHSARDVLQLYLLPTWVCCGARTESSCSQARPAPAADKEEKRLVSLRCPNHGTRSGGTGYEGMDSMGTWGCWVVRLRFRRASGEGQIGVGSQWEKGFRDTWGQGRGVAGTYRNGGEGVAEWGCRDTWGWEDGVAEWGYMGKGEGVQGHLG